MSSTNLPQEMLYPMPSGDPSLAYKVLGSTWTMITVSTVFLGLRLYCRAVRTKQIWWDDYLLVVGWMFLLSSLGMQTFIFREGYLTTILSGPVVSPVNLASDSTMKLALAFSKTSFAVTLLRLTSGWLRYLVLACAVVMSTMCLLHAVLVWRAPCGRPGKPYHIHPCWAATSGIWMNMIGSIISATSDFTLALVPTTIVSGLHMARREKIGVAVAMSLGVCAGTVAIFTAVESRRVATVVGPEFSYRLAQLSIWIPAEPNAAIIAGSIPVLRVLFRDVRNRYGSNKATSAGGYIKSNGQSNFHTGSSRNAVETSVHGKGDDGSETSILAHGEPSTRIKQTRRITVKYESRDTYNGYGEGESIEMDDRPPRRG